MNKELSDYILREPIRATIAHSIDPQYQNEIHFYLSRDYSVQNGLFTFPAGACLSYIVDEKNYNPDRSLPLSAQKEQVANYLSGEGYDEDDIRRFLSTTEYQDGREISLSPAESEKWFELHPEYKEDALRILNEAQRELEKIRESIETRLNNRKTK